MNNDWHINLRKCILQRLTPHLRYIDLIALTHVSKFFFENIPLKTIAKELIQKTLEKNNVFYDNLVCRMNSSSVLFGGMIMGVVMDDIPNKSDLDLLFYQKEDNLYKPVEKINVIRGKNNDHEIEFTFNIEHHYKGCIGEIAYSFGLVKTDGSSSDGRMYQFVSILTPSSSICNYIDKNCDLDCTKIFWDGSKIYIKDYLIFIYKRVVFDIDKYFHMNYRFLKYFGRDWQDDMWYYIVKIKMPERYRKYSKRFTLVDRNDKPLEKNSIKIITILKDIINRNHLDLPRYFDKKDVYVYSNLESYCNRISSYTKNHDKKNVIQYAYGRNIFMSVPENCLYKYGIDVPKIYRYDNIFLHYTKNHEDRTLDKYIFSRIKKPVL